MILFCLGIGAGSHAGPLVIARSQSPVNDIAETVLLEAYKTLGTEVAIRRYPDQRSLVMADRGKIDGDVLRGRHAIAHFPHLMVVPVPLVRVQIHGFAQRKDVQVKSWDDVKSYFPGFRKGIVYIEDKTAGSRSVNTDDEQELFHLLSHGRIDLAIEFRISGLLALERFRKTGHVESIRMLEPPLYTGNGFHLLHQRHKELVPRLVGVLKKMEVRGRIREIREAYIQARTLSVSR